MKRIATLAALVLAFAAAGCGGDDDGSNVRNIGGTTTGSGSGSGSGTGSGTSTGGTSTESDTETETNEGTTTAE